ncbi:hypothetical protein A2833_00725 [Candidatus Azambacteria bacterium RIFCSPHIGHO2_01_FULL_44_55]|uniref:Band 7 domain-containing protein n=1 Tax=Candidatus Azambacteria bacterium RIFCSPLOWO2_02_FULL_44_14 TaxID=1797306 RepID=A0A1F5CCZ3_9BACT|nr:MAG: hypothetical protein A3A18_00345 [Candidatus Azambacteria bacterium RIFCSPLOWO2_01_FULL_44_84]OGD33282.1 MAG: hypothetical protein A3C78_01705 [Candidatus Azambacteria bacterium RIFCSPHIGHO2_02_FULL_45_18]OGD40728.1 MAG: hypothetical protein A3I30_00095 [Candidatus Azambacteria bacterium RIFCSPLOWO2_02_FULL_44_14]OGD40828.1 MAG: hypothetical protein A2833_00725 [Candidatus Azambacteria bacterium RIFCSPHIGHO2_01_FULL_44_55]OGD51541.1 MAG: hypothetical protein A2608_01235 [Candidatus Azam
MTKTVWESHSWLSRLAFYHWLPLIGFVLIVLGFSFVSSIEIGSFSIMAVGLLVFLYYVKNSERIFRSDRGESLAILDDNGKVDYSGLKEVYLRPWPLKSRLKVVRYPTEFIFHTPLHPITSNPKVIPIDVSVIVEFEKSGMTSLYTAPNFPDFLSNPQSYKQQFYKNAFKAIQHDLPQELANCLNPYDFRTADELTNYVADRLQATLPFESNIHCAVKHGN